MSKANIVAIERQREALIKITANIEEVKLQILEGKFERGNNDETITNWSKNVEEQVEKVDAEVEKLQKYLDEMKANEASKAKEAERAQQLQFEKEQFEHKVDEIKKDKTTKKPDQIQTKLPKLIITPFNGAPTDWLRFWNIFETEIDNNSDIAPVTKFAYLKKLLKPNVRSTIDGLPFSTEGYTRAKNILKNKYGNTTEIVNAYVQNIMALPVMVPGHFAERHFAERHFAERHFAERTFCRRTFCRTDVLPNGRFAERTFCRTDSLPNGQLAENRDVISSKCLGL